MAFKDPTARAAAEKNEVEAETAKSSGKTASASGTVKIGKVVRTGVGTYDFRVVTGSGDYYTCSLVSKATSAPFGYSEAVLPLEGTDVLFVPAADATGYGYIIGAVPGNLGENTGNDEDVEESPNVPQQGYTTPVGPGGDTESAYQKPLDDTKDGRGGAYFGSFKLIDVFPGDYVILNENGVGIDGDMLTMSIRGGHASLSASRIDDTARIICRNFRFYGSRGSTVLFTDGGCITSESTFSQYIGERTGGSGVKIFRDPIKDDTKDDTDSTEEEEKAKPVIKSRIKTFLGYLGGILSVFLSKPDKNNEEAKDARRDDDDKPKDNGLMQLNVNDNGRVMFRSAGGFVLERSDRIPVPVRITEFDSPRGVKEEDIEKKDVLKFELPEDDEGNKSPHYMQLALNDKLAYDYRSAYDRFIEHIPSFGKGKSTGNTGISDDFYLRNEQELDRLTDDAGIPDRKIKPDDLDGSTGRKAGMYVLPSGEIVIRDAWGSEIMMTGGNIVINTPGSVKSNTGHSFIIQAADDIVEKARHSIDIDATENDITIKGDRNVRIAAGSDDTPDVGGIILESMSFGNDLTVPHGYENVGEDAVSTGIVLKATGSHVSLLGRKTLIGATDEVRVATGTEKNSRSGRFSIATGQVGVAANDGIVASCGEAGVTVTSDAVAVVGGSVVVSGRNGVLLAKSGQIGVPIWIDFKADFVSPYIKRMQEYLKAAQKDELNEPLDLNEMQDSPLFTYRTSEQCGTETGFELTDTPDNFTEYQPYWTVLAKMKVGTLKDMELEEWELHTINGEYPWPGTYAVENGKYAMLDETQAGEDGTFNTMKVPIKITTKDENGKDKEDTLYVACSKDYDKIKGNEKDYAKTKGKEEKDKEGQNGEGSGSGNENGAEQGKEEMTKMLVKLENLSKYIVPVIDDEKDEEQTKTTNT